MIKDLIALNKHSRVWIYPCSEGFTHDELDLVRPEIHEFLDQWTSHNRDLVTYGNVFHKRFLALFVDESVSGASGCSIDKSVHFMQHLASKYNKDFFNRTEIYLLIDDEIEQHSINELSALYTSNKINDDTLFFDNLVSTKEEFLTSWLKPISKSWLRRFL